MIGPAHNITPTPPRLAVLPMPVPVPDADFTACYARISENLTRPSAELAVPAALVLLGHGARRVSDAEPAKVSASRAGILHAVTLANRVLTELISAAMADARALLDAAGMKQPDDSDLDLFAQIGSGAGHVTMPLEIALGSNCRLANVDAFLSADLPAPLRRLAHVALYRMSVMAPLCAYVPVLMAEDEFAVVRMGYNECPMIAEVIEDWACKRIPAWDDAVDQIREHAALSDLDTQEAEKELAAIWDRLHYTPGDDAPELGTLPSNERVLELAEAAEAAGFDHDLIRYAKAVVAIDRELTARIDRHADFPQAEADNSHMMLMVTTNGTEWDYAADCADSMAQCGEGPMLTIVDLRDSSWNALCDLLTGYYAQALCFEALCDHGLFDDHQNKDYSHV